LSVPVEELDSLKLNPAVIRLYSSKTKLEKRGKDYFGLCVLHSEKSGSFTVSQDSRGFWLWHCFGGCGGGDILSFVQKTDKCTFNEAVKTVQDFLGSDPKKSHVDKIFKPLEEKPKEYKTFTLAEYKKLEDALASSSEGMKWLQEQRGITYETAKRLHVGFRQDLGKIGEKDPKIQEVRNKGWIAFPYFENDKVVLIKYRSVVQKITARQPGMKTTLFGMESIDPFEPIVVVEGEPDRIIMEQAGFRSVALPMSGFTLTPELRDALECADGIILAGDCDQGPGIKAMERLKQDFGDKAILVKWPDGYKDANETFIRCNKMDVNAFKDHFNELIARSKSQPMKGVYNLSDTMLSSDQVPLVNHPDRLRFPWKSVDEMAINLPGSVVFSTSTNSGMGKSILWMNVTLHGARKHNNTVLNYQCEMDRFEFSAAAAAHLTMRDRNNLSPEDYKKASVLLKNVSYYVGSDPTLETADEVLDLIEAAVKRLGITHVVLDHIHYVCGQESDPIQAQNRAMQRIKNMAMIYGLIFIVLGQPRKADQKTKGKELHLTDAKGAGSLIDNSNSAYFIHRETIKNIDPANPPMDEYEPETTVRNKKARSKGRGASYAKLFYNGTVATFLEISHQEEPEDMFQ